MLLVQNFTVKNNARLTEFLDFKEANLINTLLRFEPLYDPNDGSFKISIRSEVNDIITLESLFEKWNKEDLTIIHTNTGQSLFSKIFTRLRA